ncbi:MAG: LPS export ABC transporter periplasmic protein LptC [Proteobacteria bacterium]|nr:LPS export ABC transporter periplasmic protein LptC [Pseudomonadota bacterium]MBU1386981.1 LPS export ABC transporter periplasmic protein LptC [Pseudomonadota bacterium]MBU1542338.1 LPS export ABC transporter periplasmic protein LptC [Pseudomonadota bacterium]MBU2481801.1 LPS export ABC transporter periplasmic protein LptC [Pseudomonadota bacterium]
MTRTLKQKLTLPLAGLLVLIIIILGGLIYFNNLISTPIEFKDIKVDHSSSLKLNALKQISKKNGIKEWELQAASARLMKEENKAILQDISITFFTKDNKKVHLTSDNGQLNTQTHDMHFSGNVMVDYESFTLKTDKLHYNKKEHIIHTDTHVRLEKAESVIDADSMTTRLNENMTILTGHVKGIFSENFDIQ